MCKFVYLCVLGSACVYLKLCQRAPPALLCTGASSAKSASSIIPLRRCLIRISKTCAKYSFIRYTNTHTDSRTCTKTDKQTFSCLRTRDIHSPSLSLSLSFTLSRSRARFSMFALSRSRARFSKNTYPRALNAVIHFLRVPPFQNLFPDFRRAKRLRISW